MDWSEPMLAAGGDSHTANGYDLTLENTTASIVIDPKSRALSVECSVHHSYIIGPHGQPPTVAETGFEFGVHIAPIAPEDSPTGPTYSFFGSASDGAAVAYTQHRIQPDGGSSILR